MTKFCPLAFMINTTIDRELGEQFRCSSSCAWYIHEYKCCAMALIAERADDIRFYLDIIQANFEEFVHNGITINKESE